MVTHLGSGHITSRNSFLNFLIDAQSRANIHVTPGEMSGLHEVSLMRNIDVYVELQ